MNLQLLIDSIVRQTTVLMAQLATSGGARAPLHHVANQVFSDLAEELERQGLSRAVTADMFGISLRSYQRKVARLRESSSESGRSLWEAVLQFLASRRISTRAEVLQRFERDPEPIVRGMLTDLVESGLVFCTGAGAEAVYRATSEEELEAMRRAQAMRGLDEFVWAIIYRQGPLELGRIADLVKLKPKELAPILERLVQSGRVQSQAADSSGSGETLYSSALLVVESSGGAGWEASVYDHFQAMVRTICSRLEDAPDARQYAGFSGGSTYSFDVGLEHPLRDEVLSTLAQFRERCSDLRKRVMAYNEAHGEPESIERVVTYAGQSVICNPKDKRGELDQKEDVE